MSRRGGPSGAVLGEGTERVAGDAVKESTVQAARTVAEVVRSTLGPKGMDKMLVTANGDVVITNDGVTILREMRVDDPTAKLVIEVAKTQEDEAGDGTTTAVAIAGALLANAQELFGRGIHPTTIVRGFNLAVEQAQREIDAIATRTDPDDEDRLRKVAETSMTGKGADTSKDVLAALVVDAVRRLAVEDDAGERVVDLGLLKVETVPGRAADRSEAVDGSVLRADPVHPDMPHEVENARILLLDQPIEVDESPVDTEVEIDDADGIRRFIEGWADSEEDELSWKVERIVDAGANVVICHDEIDEVARYLLAKEDVLAVHDLSKEAYGDETSEIAFLRDAFDARIVSDFEAIEPDMLVNASVRYEPDEGLFYVESDDALGVTLLAGGSTQHVSEELRRGIEDAVDTVAGVVRDGRVLPGGGATEVELAARLREYADGIHGREQLAIEAFADALELIPRTLAANAGLDTIDALVDLRAAHAAGDVAAGLDAVSGDIVDTLEAGVIEPARVKTQAIAAAAEVAGTVVKIDEIIEAEDFEEDRGPPPDLGFELPSEMEDDEG